MTPYNISSPVGILFERWPETVRLFTQNRMACPGCYLASFESLEGALQIYQINQAPFLKDIHKIITDSGCEGSQAFQELSDSAGEPKE